MPVASYQQSNDYSLVDRIKPFNLPYESTMQEIATKTQYWKVGADNVKSVYDRAVNLDPQFVQNRDYLKNFMDQANKNLQKINKSDLGVFDNSLEATKIFDPLYDVKNPFNYRLLADSQINKHYQKQQKLSETYRTKDGGKEWNQNNDFYFRDAQQKYMEDAKNGNLESIDTHLQKRKSFIPYYDFKKEILDLQEACKGQSYANKSIANNNQLYFVENSKSGCTPQELALAFKTGLSDRAKQQMQIDGYVHFKGNEDELAKQFADIQVNKAQTNADNIKAKIAGMKDGGVSKDEEERLKFYENQLAVLEPELKEAKEEFQKMTGGNTLEYVKNNYDRLAGQVYFNDLATNLAEAYRTDDTKNIVSPNPVGMLRLKLEVERANMYIQKDLDKELDNNQSENRKEEIILKGQVDIETERQKVGITGSTGLPKPIEPVNYENQKPETITENDYKKSDLIPAKQRAETTQNVIFDLVKKSLGKDSVTEEEVGNYITELEKGLKLGKTLDENGKSIIEAYNRFKNAKDNLQFVNNQIASADAAVKKQLGDNYSESKTFSLKFGDNIMPGVKLSKEEISDIMFNNKIINGISYHKNDANSFGQRGIFKYKGVVIDNDISNLLNKLSSVSLYGIKSEIEKERPDRNKKIDKLKTEFYSKNQYINSKYYDFNKMDFGKPEDFENRYGENIKKSFEITGGLNAKNGYQVYARDKFGSGIFIKLLDEDGEVRNMSRKDVDKEIAKLGKHFNNTQIEVDEKSGSFYIKNILPEYTNMPNRLEIEKYDKLKSSVTSIEEILSTDKKFNDAITIDSREIPEGGTVRYVSNRNIEYIISLYKEQGEPLQYVATYMRDGKEAKYKARSMNELIPYLY